VGNANRAMDNSVVTADIDVPQHLADRYLVDG
jgi:hypothetical protein